MFMTKLVPEIVTPEIFGYEFGLNGSVPARASSALGKPSPSESRFGSMPTALCSCSQTSLMPLELTSRMAETRVPATRNGASRTNILHQRGRVKWEALMRGEDVCLM